MATKKPKKEEAEPQDEATENERDILRELGWFLLPENGEEPDKD